MPKTFEVQKQGYLGGPQNVLKTRMHSSRMRTARFKRLVARISWHALLPGGVPGTGGVPGPGGCTWSGGVPGLGGCTWSQGVYLPRYSPPGQNP